MSSHITCHYVVELTKTMSCWRSGVTRCCRVWKGWREMWESRLQSTGSMLLIWTRWSQRSSDFTNYETRTRSQFSRRFLVTNIFDWLLCFFWNQLLNLETSYWQQQGRSQMGTVKWVRYSCKINCLIRFDIHRHFAFHRWSR